MVRVLVVFGQQEAVRVQQIECQAKSAWASLRHVVPEQVAFTFALDKDGLAGRHLHGVVSDFEYGGSFDVAQWHGAVVVVSLAECRHIELEPESLVGGRDSAKGGIWMGRAICVQGPEVQMLAGLLTEAWAQTGLEPRVGLTKTVAETACCRSWPLP